MNTRLFPPSSLRPTLSAIVALLVGQGCPLQAADGGFAFTQTSDRLAITSAGRPVAEFVFRDGKILRPYFANIHAPNGRQVTRNHPPVAGQDATDHDTMHPGLWLAFGDISGQDFWRNKARIEHVRFTEPPKAANGRLTFATESNLRTTNGAPLCSLTNRITLVQTTNAWLLIWEATFRSDAGDFTFGDQEEMGFGARVATAITEKNGGVITSSAGLRTAKVTWGQPAEWCDYSGTVEGQRLGITLMTDPANFRPSWWHNRDYGVFVANPFGREAMKQGAKNALTVKRGESLRLRFGALFYSMPDGGQMDCRSAYREFAAARGLSGKVGAGEFSIEFVAIPAGSFTMGADLPRETITAERAVFIQDEFPLRRVTITRGFDLSEHEITNVEYERYDPAHRSLRGNSPGISTRDNEAVVFVSWDDAGKFCHWLSGRDSQYDYRLPTEAEWEYACRAGTRTAFNDGIEGDLQSLNPLGPLASEWRIITNWFVTRGNKNTDNIAHSSPGAVDLTVGRQGPNAWGLFDMHGGVEEWTQDWYGPYAESDVVDPVGYAEGTSKVVRGGSHNVHLQTLRSANRSSALMTDKHCLLGFRVVRVAKGERLPTPKLTQVVPQWAQSVSRTVHAWPADSRKPFFQGPRSLYTVADTYHTPALAAKFQIPLYTHNHSPAITWAPNGDLLLVWFSGESEKGQELTILGLRGRRQADGRLVWDEEVSEFFKAADRNMHGSQLWNNASRLAHGAKEPFTVYHINGICTDGKWSKLAMSFRQSTDNGATWTAPVMVKPDTDAFHLEAARNQPQGNVVVTARGEFLCFADGGLSGGSGSSVNFSSDGGATWSVRGKPGPPGIHAAGIEVAAGRLLAMSRDSGATFGSLPQSLSTDLGQTWSSSTTEFPPVKTVQRVVLLRLDYSNAARPSAGSAQAPILLVSFADRGIQGQDAGGQAATLFGTFAALSWDAGQTWPIKRVLSSVKQGSEIHTMAPWNEKFTLDATHGQPKAYWAATQTPDGVVHLTDGRLYYAFNLAWLAGAPQG